VSFEVKPIFAALKVSSLNNIRLAKKKAAFFHSRQNALFYPSQA